ncbi:MAG: prolipoprotein diacylglyceryl transferase [Hyphomicrobium sp.]|uniref:prolipoprotein diacylglyceryl transferase n=1 Tax=Hyphomicrobium sp. TaxID=82 RepID=UPI003D09E14D
MNLLAIPFPDIDPAAISIGWFSIKWYGLSYLVGLILGWIYIRRLISEPRLWAGNTAPFPADKVDDLLLYITVGVVAGGRLGYVLLYEPGTYLADPSQIVAVWKGGMSFHGALAGCALAGLAFAYRNGVNFLSSMDLTTASVPIGLVFGRLANFINGELWGRPTDVAWAVVFCNDRIKAAHGGVCPAGELPRHPSQLYEAALEGIVLFIVLRLLTHHFGALKRPGLISGAFLIGYALARSTAELLREPHFMAGPLTAGQLYSLPMLAGGLLLVWYAQRSAAHARTQ